MSKLLEKINALKAHRDTVLAPLEAKSDQWTAEDRKAYEEGISKAEAFQKDITLLEKSSGIDAFMASGAAAQVAKDAAGGNAGMAFEGKAGTTTLDAKGNLVEQDGEDISSKVLSMTMEKSYKAAFGRFLRKSGHCDLADLKTLRDVAKKAMSEGLDSDGGVLVPVDIIMEIIQRKGAATSVVDLVRNVPTARDKASLPWFKYNDDDIKTSALAIQWVGEGRSATEDTGLQDWGFKEFQVYKGMIPVKVTDDFLEDTAMPIEPWIMEMLGDARRYGLENVIINGTGVGTPRGFLSGAGGTDRVPTQNVGNPITMDGMIDLDYALPSQYADNASYIARRTVIGTLAKLKDAANHYVGLVESLDKAGLSARRNRVIQGAPLYQSEYMPAGGGAANAIAYGDLRQAYALVTRLGVTINPFGEGDEDMQLAGMKGFLLRFRTGGDVLQDRAMVIGVQS
jgi:HK97 family phage major capsid protein